MSKQGNFLINQTVKLNTWFYFSTFFYWAQLALYKLSFQLIQIFFYHLFFFKALIYLPTTSNHIFVPVKTLKFKSYVEFNLLTHFYLTTYIFFIFLYRLAFFAFNFIFYFVICFLIDT